MPDCKKRKPEEQIVNFLDLDTSKIIFQNQSQTNTMEVKLTNYMKEKHNLLNMKDIHSSV